MLEHINSVISTRKLGTSPAGLTRGSIVSPKELFTKKMDGRVKPGHDRGGWAAVLSPSPAGLTRGSMIFVKPFLRRGWIGPRVKPGEVKPGNDDRRSGPAMTG